MEKTNTQHLSEYEFVIRAIKKLRKPPYKGIHSVYSGFNQAFREYFDKDPVEATTKLATEGKIATRPVKGGVLLYLPDDAPVSGGAKSVLNKILEEDESDDELIILGTEENKKE
jgi:hypothetical protein